MPAYFGYPITPQNELPEYVAEAFAKMKDAVFIQAESEIASINMVIGASVAGARVMTSSSSPGISLKQEGISYLAGMELPALIVNMMRGGPGLGNIAPSQGDYFQATKGGGHGDYRVIVLAPASGQEIADMTWAAFHMADHYRNPVMILGDGMMGQMMEPVELPDPIDPTSLPKREWVLDGAHGRPSRIIRSLWLDPNLEEELNWRLVRKYEVISKEIADQEDVPGRRRGTDHSRVRHSGADCQGWRAQSQGNGAQSRTIQTENPVAVSVGSTREAGTKGRSHSGFRDEHRSDG